MSQVRFFTLNFNDFSVIFDQKDWPILSKLYWPKCGLVGRTMNVWSDLRGPEKSNQRSGGDANKSYDRENAKNMAIILGNFQAKT